MVTVTNHETHEVDAVVTNPKTPEVDAMVTRHKLMRLMVR